MQKFYHATNPLAIDFDCNESTFFGLDKRIAAVASFWRQNQRIISTENTSSSLREGQHKLLLPENTACALKAAHRNALTKDRIALGQCTSTS